MKPGPMTSWTTSTAALTTPPHAGPGAWRAARSRDLSAEAIETLRLPALAAGGDPGPFLRAHRLAVLLSGFGANGLYTLVVLILATVTRAHYPRAVGATAGVVGVSGIALSVAAWSGSVAGMVWSNDVLVPALLVWWTGIGRDARARLSGE